MTCQYFSSFCLFCSLVIMTSSVRSQSFNKKSHAIPPVISEGPDYHVYFNPTGDRITLRCVATGTAPIEYDWLRNGVPLEVDDRMKVRNNVLLMENPTTDYEGRYQCIARNVAGAAMSNITLVQAAVLDSSADVRLRTAVKSLQATFAEHLKFPCNHITKSIPAPVFEWKRKTADEYIPLNKSDIRITQTSDGWIVFAYVQMDDSGEYKCSAYNGFRRMSLDGSKFNLSVEDGDASVMERKVHEAPVLLYSTSNATMVEGENLTLTCVFGSWPLGYQVEWVLPSGEMVNGSSFTIENASIEDEGVYNCRAFKTTTLGSKLYSQTGDVSVKIDAIPSFTIFPTNQEVVRGQRANFSCQGQGRPTPNVTWYANGISLGQIKDTPQSYVMSSDGPTEFLYINDIQTTATVTCNISNSHGYRLHSAKIVFASEDDIDITNPSSQSRFVQPPTASAELSSTLGKTSTEPYHEVSTYSKRKFTLKENDISKDGHLGNSDALTSNRATSIIYTSAGVVGGLVVVVVIIIVVVVYIRRRRRRRNRADPVVPQDYRPRNEFLIVDNVRVAYDSDDSGLGVDDQRTEANERRNLRQP